MKISFIVPAFNEEKFIEDVIKCLLNINLTDNLEKEIIIIDDFSTDNTYQIISKYDKNPIVKIERQNKRSGKGAAVRRGIELATGDIIAVQDADLEYNPIEYLQLIELFKGSNVSAVYGSRFKGKIEKMNPYNRLGNILLTNFCNLLYFSNLTDVYTCYKLIDSKLIKNLNLISNGFEIEAEITAKLLNKKIKIIEIPINYQGRTIKEGKKIKPVDALKGVFAFIKYRF